MDQTEHELGMMYDNMLDNQTQNHFSHDAHTIGICDMCGAYITTKYLEKYLNIDGEYICENCIVKYECTTDDYCCDGCELCKRECS